MLSKILEQRLNNYKQANLYRTRRVLSTPQAVQVNCNRKNCISFCSNDYLGLANHPKIIRAFKRGAEQYGVGSGASQLISGYSHAHQELEQAFATFLNRDRTLLFSSGYMANVGVLSALVKKGDVIFQDKFNHASLIDAARLTNASVNRYMHNNIEHLQWLLQTQIQNRIQDKYQKLIASESVFSMQGDIAPLVHLANLAKINNASLMIDDAHGIGVLGVNGRGALEHFSLSQNDVEILICPLGKAFGCMGALVAGSTAMVENLIQFSRSFIYTTALPPAMACAALASLQIVQRESWRREKLQYLITYFKRGARQRNLVFLSSETAIQILILSNAEAALSCSKKLFMQGFLVVAIRPPSVPKNNSCLRITLSCMHEEQHIDSLLDALIAIKVEMKNDYLF